MEYAFQVGDIVQVASDGSAGPRTYVVRKRLLPRDGQRRYELEGSTGRVEMAEPALMPFRPSRGPAQRD